MKATFFSSLIQSKTVKAGELIVLSIMVLVLFLLSVTMPVYAEEKEASWHEKWEKVMNSAKTMMQRLLSLGQQ